MPYHELTSEKYLAVAVEQEIKAIRRQKNRDALQVFRHFLFAIVVMIGVGYALQSMPTWLPNVVGTMEYYGVLPANIPAQ